jgi:hypothetical protein
MFRTQTKLSSEVFLHVSGLLATRFAFDFKFDQHQVICSHTQTSYQDVAHKLTIDPLTSTYRIVARLKSQVYAFFKQKYVVGLATTDLKCLLRYHLL